ncbi:hypothetical protein Goari_004494 [Gossypium aridum]|uniref:DUF4283 domain-containing protein n=1 Tax=Gossypium aridum TaxID=34290 RepID=A0A7J8Y542_GOSAI|nr:hypothetical protein [Gossypium aridum]
MSNSEAPPALERLILLISSELERAIKKIKNKDYLDLESKDMVQLVDLEHDYYIVKFSIISDYKKALIDGPWTIYERYLIVQPRSRDFSTDKSYPFQVLAWVRFPGLPYRYYTKGIFRTLASEVGRIVKIDYNTIGGRKGKFTRMAIFVYLNKPLVPCIDIDGFTKKIEYEGLLQICYGCRSCGHVQEVCVR